MMENIDRSAPVYSIGIVRQLTGLSGRQIRYYEEMGLITPSRTEGKRRIYSPNDVDLLFRIKDLIGKGYNIEGIKRIIKSGTGGNTPSPNIETNTDAAGSPNDGIFDAKDGVENADSVPFFIDHELLVSHLPEFKKLTSLYPINNREQLVKILIKLREDVNTNPESDL